MVAFSDVVPAGANVKPRWMSRKATKGQRRAGRLALAGIARFTGVVLMLAAVGIWILSGPLLDAEMMLVRLTVSLLFMCTGLMLLHGGRGSVRDEIHLDPQTRELRHVQRGRDGIARTRRSFAMTDLGEITISDDQLILKSGTGEVVMELSGLPREQLHLIDRELRNF
ncbi:MAG: hypothetical protein V2I53_11120 [Paracoccaceae bacterium]|jgi:hypothetical protein|nr:hypothetical protein [Paracoccaceae bacterium]